MKRLALAFVLVAAACGSGSDTPIDATEGDGRIIDGPLSAPMITSFTASPTTIPAGVATDVTWNWTYVLEPTLPDPTCTINNNVGAVTRGMTTSVTINAVTTFTLTCVNSEGQASRQVVVAIPPARPMLATFTATPATLVPGQATNVTWNWTYSNAPSPPPACSIDGIGTVTQGMQSSITQTASRVYRLRCMNSQGASTPLTTNVNVDECTANTDDCQVNATCTDTPSGFTCACNQGFVGDGDRCDAAMSCTQGVGPCDVNADCINGTSCRCKPTYVGDGLTCTRNLIAFTTSATGNGNLSSWAGAGGMTGLAAADEICRTSALAGGFSGTFVAWMSNSLNDAYCRVHGFPGTRDNMCGQLALPNAAGPWVRPDGKAFAPAIAQLLPPGRTIYYPASVTELGADLAITERVYTGTDENGRYTPNATCGDWTSSSSVVFGAMGDANGGGGGSWTDIGATDPNCLSTGHLRCVQTSTGPALPSRHPIAKRAFITSVTGNGLLSSWADADGLTTYQAADAVCQARARAAGYANSGTFRAYLSTSSSLAITRIISNGPWARPDGVVIALTESDLLDSRIAASLYLTETGQYLAGTGDAGSVWTGTTNAGGAASFTCSSWATTSGSGQIGRHDTLDFRWSTATTQACTLEGRLYCFEDQ